MIEKADKEKHLIPVDMLPDKPEIEIVAKKSIATLQNLDFSTKRAILLKVVEKVISTQQ